MTHFRIFWLGMIVSAALLSGFTACSDDDDELGFTIDEVIQGDILTGKHVAVPGNTIGVYATRSYTVNVENARGEISAVSQDEDIATVEIVNTTDKEIVVSGHKMGNTQIIVTDSEGRIATLMVNVLDENEYWVTQATFSKISLAEDDVLIIGVSEEEAGKIRTDILTNRNQESKFVLKAGQSYPWTTYKMRVMDNEGNLLYELSHGMQIGENAYEFQVVDNKGETTKTYTFGYGKNEYSADILWEDISDDYKTEYPEVNVLLQMVVERSTTDPEAPKEEEINAEEDIAYYELCPINKYAVAEQYLIDSHGTLTYPNGSSMPTYDNARIWLEQILDRADPNWNAFQKVPYQATYSFVLSPLTEEIRLVRNDSSGPLFKNVIPENEFTYITQTMKPGEELHYALILANVYKKGLQKVSFSIKKQ